MNRPFNMPDEFVEAFMKAGASLWGRWGGRRIPIVTVSGSAQPWGRPGVSPNCKPNI